MNKKLTFKRIAALGLISTGFAFTNIEIATSKSQSISGVALQVGLGSSAQAGICNRRCVKTLAGMGGEAVKTLWQRRKDRQQEQRQ